MSINFITHTPLFLKKIVFNSNHYNWRCILYIPKFLTGKENGGKSSFVHWTVRLKLHSQGIRLRSDHGRRFLAAVYTVFSEFVRSNFTVYFHPVVLAFGLRKTKPLFLVEFMFIQGRINRFWTFFLSNFEGYIFIRLNSNIKWVYLGRRQ